MHFDGFDIVVGGDASITKQSTEIVNEDFGRSLFLNLPVTIVILMLAFGAVLAALVPVALALAAIVTANGVLAIVSQAYALSEIYTEMVLLMGLATGIDYSLFVVTRYRRERAAGRSKEQALQVASGTSGKAVVFAGVTVLLAISGMFLVDFVIFTSLAIASMVVVAIAVIVSVTLLPALLAMLGDNVDCAYRFCGRAPTWRRRLGCHHRQGAGAAGRPGQWMLVALVALAVPLVTLNLGFNGVGLPTTWRAEGGACPGGQLHPGPVLARQSSD
jgi:uncharacterized membrane protein YdfJ with MMPL/SSD domain